MGSKGCRYITALAKIESIEWFVYQEQRLWGEQTYCEQDSFPLTFRQGTQRQTHQRLKVQILYDFRAKTCRAREEAQREVDCPSNGLCGPRRNSIRHIEQEGRAFIRCDG